jgi:copper chaperone CopZ
MIGKGCILNEVPMKVCFRVPNMHCPNCAMHLEGLQDELGGIRQIRTSYKKQSLEVEFEETRLTVAQIIAAANPLGYHPEPVQA